MRILLIGAINLYNQPQGGEEYKNQLLYSNLLRDYSLEIVDTHKWKRKPRVLIHLLKSLFLTKWDRIIISASSLSVYQLIKVIQFFPSISKNTTYFVIGGYLPTAIRLRIYKIEPYEYLHSIVVEGEVMREELKKLGFKGCIHVIPNFKYLPIESNFKVQSGDLTKFLFLSRIHPDKGVREIVEASHLLLKWGFRNFTISFFGPIEPSYIDIFTSLLSSKIEYRGTLDIINKTEQSYSELSNFDVMLFPTYWIGEGFPGVLIDAFIAGLPVIATDWNMNREIIKHEENGLLIPPRDIEALAISMKKMIENPNLRNAMSTNAQKCATEYDIRHLWPRIKAIIE